MQYIWLAIQRADVIIRSSDIPFDISAMRHLTYEWTGPESFTPLVRKLGGVLSACLV